jgi:hypothetical protein
MHSKVRMSAALAVALALAAGTAQALPRPTHPPHPAAPAGLVDAARAWLASWFPGAGGGQLSAIKGREGSTIDPNGSPRSIGTLPTPSTLPPTSLPTL